MDNSILRLTWSDGHVSRYDFNWLEKRNFSKENREKYLKTVYKLPPKLWSHHQFETAYERFNYRDVIGSDDVLRDWLEALTVNGCALITGAPLEERELHNLADRVAFIRRTHYGEEFIVQVKEGTTNVAYLSTALQMHTDSPYYDYVPGVNLLHCIVQTNSPGAFNLLCDGFYVAKRLQHEHPDHFKCLTDTLVNWSDYGEEDGVQFHSVHRAPIIW